MFALIEDGYLVLRKDGVFRPAKIYVRNQYLYAGYGGGFVKLSKHDGGTSVPKLTYEDLTIPSFKPVADSIGRLMKPGT